MKRPLISIGVLLGIVVIAFFLKRGEEASTQEVRLVLPGLKLENLQSLRITAGAESILLDNKSGSWKLENWPVDSTRLHSFVQDLASLRKEDLITENFAKAGLFGLDSTARIDLKITRNNGESFVLFLGQRSKDGLYIWFSPDGEKVWRSPGVIRAGVKDSDWKSRDLFSLDTASVQSFNVNWVDSNGTKQSYSLNRGPASSNSTAPAWTFSEGKAAETGQAEKILGRVLALQVDSWPDEIPENLDSTKTFTLDVTGDEPIEFHCLGEANAAYFCKWSGVLIRLNTWRFRGIEVL